MQRGGPRGIAATSLSRMLLRRATVAEGEVEPGRSEKRALHASCRRRGGAAGVACIRASSREDHLTHAGAGGCAGKVPGFEDRRRPVCTTMEEAPLRVVRRLLPGDGGDDG